MRGEAIGEPAQTVRSRGAYDPVRSSGDPRVTGPGRALEGMMMSRRFRRVVAGPAAVALLTLGLLAVAPQFSSLASAQGSSRSCATPITSAPTGPATVTTASTSFGRVLIVGSGANAGCSLYLLTSDRLHSLTSGQARSRSEKSGPDWRKKNIRLVRPRPAAGPAGSGRHSWSSCAMFSGR